jgi:hypothetical protein
MSQILTSIGDVFSDVKVVCESKQDGLEVSEETLPTLLETVSSKERQKKDRIQSDGSTANETDPFARAPAAGSDHSEAIKSENDKAILSGEDEECHSIHDEEELENSTMSQCEKSEESEELNTLSSTINTDSQSPKHPSQGYSELLARLPSSDAGQVDGEPGSFSSLLPAYDGSPKKKLPSEHRDEASRLNSLPV